ncbi:ABC transporter ATP-binding protein [Alginatibacterium sediminis]|uniref:ABC transporter ATP-binding protein n=1 Tax=Alginatibacterium sediminis TaxID=2164068 RepID=A0A420E6Z4_9ALTE|nr:ABC transporter ATP-binding protein [Alginatibacterium sediminis]RKF13717.1 ABC transporter ATP-binding protein [Alginatibacterium sediminis]
MTDSYNSTPAAKGAWKVLFRMCYQPNKALFHKLIVMALATAVIDTSFTLVTKAVVDDLVELGAQTNLLGYGLLYLVLLLSFVACVWAFIRLAGRLSTELMYSLRKQSFEHLQRLSFSFYDQNAVGWLLARITSDSSRIANVIAWGTLDLFWGVPLIIGIFAVLLVLNFKLGLIVLGILPLLIAVAWVFNVKILKSSREVRQTNSRLTAVYNESISGVQTSKVLVREEENLREFKGDTKTMYHQSMYNLLLSSAFYPFINVFVSLGMGVALWLGGLEVLVGTLTLGTLVAFMTYTRTLMDPMLEVSAKLAELQRTTACVERVIGLLEVKPEIEDSDELKAEISRLKAMGIDMVNHEQDIETIEFVDVCFAYKANEPVLKNFSLNVAPGASIALVGATGSGKSTVVSLLCRFYEPQSGQILINGKDYRQYPLEWLQSKLGIVLQTPFLFTGTIMSNIRYGNLDASDAQVIAAAKAVNVHDIIEQMEHGYQTQVQEGGNNLSTGQKQLISFARAIIGDPQILVMDEATSSVDTQTEEILQRSLQAVLKGRTSFVIAHRLSTIRSADTIVVVDHGEILEQGNHQQLLAQQGAYFNLYQKQFQTEQQEELLTQS